MSWGQELKDFTSTFLKTREANTNASRARTYQQQVDKYGKDKNDPMDDPQVQAAAQSGTIRPVTSEAPNPLPNTATTIRTGQLYADGGLVEDDRRVIGEDDSNGAYWTAERQREQRSAIPVAAPAPQEQGAVPMPPRRPEELGGAPAPQQAAADDGGYLSAMVERARDAVDDGVSFMTQAFGLDQSRAAVPMYDGGKLRAFAQGFGAASTQDVAAAQRIVDPQGAIPLEQRNMAVLAATHDFYLRKGEPEKAKKAAASLIQYNKLVAQRLGAVAVQAFQAGDTKGGVKALTQAYAYVPDGRSVEATVNPDGSANVQQKDMATGKVLFQGRATPEQMLAQATGFASGKAAMEYLTHAAGQAQARRGGGRRGGRAAQGSPAGDAAIFKQYGVNVGGAADVPAPGANAMAAETPPAEEPEPALPAETPAEAPTEPGKPASAVPVEPPTTAPAVAPATPAAPPTESAIPTSPAPPLPAEPARPPRPTYDFVDLPPQAVAQLSSRGLRAYLSAQNSAKYRYQQALREWQEGEKQRQTNASADRREQFSQSAQDKRAQTQIAADDRRSDRQLQAEERRQRRQQEHELRLQQSPDARVRQSTAIKEAWDEFIDDNKPDEEALAANPKAKGPQFKASEKSQLIDAASSVFASNRLTPRAAIDAVTTLTGIDKANPKALNFKIVNKDDNGATVQFKNGREIYFPKDAFTQLVALRGIKMAEAQEQLDAAEKEKAKAAERTKRRGETIDAIGRALTSGPRPNTLTSQTRMRNTINAIDEPERGALTAASPPSEPGARRELTDAGKGPTSQTRMRNTINAINPAEAKDPGDPYMAAGRSIRKGAASASDAMRRYKELIQTPLIEADEAQVKKFNAMPTTAAQLNKTINDMARAIEDGWGAAKSAVRSGDAAIRRGAGSVAAATRQYGAMSKPGKVFDDTGRSAPETPDQLRAWKKRVYDAGMAAIAAQRTYGDLSRQRVIDD